VIWVQGLRFGTAPSLRLDRVAAETTARDLLMDRVFRLGPDWRAQALVTAHRTLEHQFVWREGGRDEYLRLLGAFLQEPGWRIRFLNFQVEPEERAESFSVWLSAEGVPERMAHALPEGRPAASLKEEEARDLAYTGLRERLGAEPSRVREISAEESVRPERTDWTFTFEALQGYSLREGEARLQVEIAGNRVVDVRKFVYVPQEWEREWRAESSRRSLASFIPIGLLLLAALGGLITSVVLWARGELLTTPLQILSLGVGAVMVLTAANEWPEAQSAFTTQLSLGNQVILALVGMVLGSAMIGFGTGLAAALGHTWLQEPKQGVRGGVFLGFPLGLLFVVSSRAFSHWATDGPPPWPDYSGAVSFFPVLASTLYPIMGFLTLTALALLFLGTLRRLSGTRWSWLSVTLLLLLGLVLAPNPPDSPWIAWIAGATGMGAAVGAFWAACNRWGWSLVPGAVMAIVWTSGMETLLSRPFPGASLGSGLGMVVVLFLVMTWSRSLESGHLLGKPPGQRSAGFEPSPPEVV
jgi:hypothetical protein